MLAWEKQASSDTNKNQTEDLKKNYLEQKKLTCFLFFKKAITN